jgi:lipopolysaccharide transport protein LptA
MTRTGPILASILAALSLTAAAEAQQQQQEAPGGAPVRVYSDSQEFFQKEGRGYFTGNVVVTRGDARLTTTKLTGFCVKSPPDPDGKQECSGEFDPLVAEGDVLYTAPDAKIRGDKAVYQTGTGIITVTGDVILTRSDECVMRGTEVVYNIEQGSVKVTAGSNRVLSICTPKKKDAAPSVPGAAPANRPN